jgi:hypothetical protein
VARLVAHRDFTAATSVLMGIVPWVMVRQADAIRHPIDPIGRSSSAAMQGFYWLILVTVVALAIILVAWLWLGAEMKAGGQ